MHTLQRVGAKGGLRSTRGGDREGTSKCEHLSWIKQVLRKPLCFCDLGSPSGSVFEYPSHGHRPFCGKRVAMRTRSRLEFWKMVIYMYVCVTVPSVTKR